MTKQRQRFSTEFKLEVIALVTDQGYSIRQAADAMGVGTFKGVGRVYQQTFVDTYSKVAHAKLYTTKTPITAADLLNDRVLPFY